jgi:5-(carboxyamino)imidazole ribonucleotide synthase
VPPAVIGILGGGQLGRMLGLAARAMGYRVAVLDPDPDCPAAAVADRLIIGSYDDVGAAMRLADVSAVVTYELEHVAADVVEALELRVPVRPGRGPLRVTQDRLAERRFVEAAGVAVAPWREVRSVAEARAAAGALGLPLRLKVPIGGYDGRGQVRIAVVDELDDAWERLGRRAGDVLLAERELDFAVGSRCRRARVDGATRLPRRRNRTTRNPRGIGRAGPAAAGLRTARSRSDDAGRGDGSVRTLTAELFLLRDGSLVVNELAPGPQLRPLDDRGRRDLAVRAAHPGGLRARARVAGGALADCCGQPPRDRSEA